MTAGQKRRFSAINRRRFLGGAAAGTALAATAWGRSAQAAGELNVLVWCDHADSKLIDPFAAAHDVTVNVKTFEGTGTALSILEQSQPGDWDVLVVDAPDVPRVVELGLLAPVPEDAVPWDDMFPAMREAPYARVDGTLYAVPEKFGYYGFCYNKNNVDPADAASGEIGWMDKYSGRIGVYDYYFPVIQMIGRQMGWLPTEIDSDKLAQIREKLLAMKPNVKMVGDIVSVQNALVTGDVDVIVGGAEFAVSNLIPSNPHLDWVISDAGGLIWNQGLCIVASSERKDLAAEFVKYTMSPAGQGALATSDCYWAMPANSKAEVPDDAKTILRWDQQEAYLDKSVVAVFPDAEMDAEMLDLWTEFLQS
ncbi:MAG: extracellular solute-binding protein [Dongiaceae bacterium]